MGGQKALLLDRDGVINVDHGYVGTVERFRFMEGIFALTRAAVDLGWRIIVVTNQSGIARGHYGEDDFRAVTTHMREGFASAGVVIEGVLHCPFHPDGVVPGLARDSFWRKPGPGMILEAARRFDLDLGRSIMIGDGDRDIAAAAAAGVGTRLLLTDDPAAATDGRRVVIRRLEDAIPFLGGPAIPRHAAIPVAAAPLEHARP